MLRFTLAGALLGVAWGTDCATRNVLMPDDLATPSEICKLSVKGGWDELRLA